METLGKSDKNRMEPASSLKILICKRISDFWPFRLAWVAASGGKWRRRAGKPVGHFHTMRAPCAPQSGGT
jgi:hypothetical protein